MEPLHFFLQETTTNKEEEIVHKNLVPQSKHISEGCLMIKTKGKRLARKSLRSFIFVETILPMDASYHARHLNS